MKTSTKKILALVACLVMMLTVAFAVVACDNKFQENDDIVRDENGNILFRDDKGNPTKLKVWSVLDDPDYTYQVQVNRAFNDYYSVEGIEAEITSVNVGRYYTQLANAINTDPENAPDVVIFHSERLTNMATDNILIPMNKYLTLASEVSETAFSADNYLTNVINECYYNDELYAVPIDVHSGVWFVRDDILKANGLSKPTNMDEFVAVCNALIQKNEAGTLKYRKMEKGAGANTSWQTGSIANFYPVSMSGDNGIQNGWIPQTAVFQNGGTLSDNKGMPAWGNVEGFKNIMSIFRDWQTTGGSYEGTPYAGQFVSNTASIDTIWQDLAQARSIFVCEGPWRIETQMNQYREVFGDDSGLSIMGLSGLYTTDETSANANKVYGVGHCVGTVKTVTSATKRVAAALYAKFMTEECADYMKGGHLPACKTVLNSSEYKNLPAYERYLKDMGDPANFVMLGNTKNYSEVYEGLKRVYVDIFTESKKNTSVADIIRIRYEEAINNINSFDDL